MAVVASQALGEVQWEALASGTCLEEALEAQEALLKLPLAQGASFTFDDVSVLTGEAEGALAVTTVSRGWTAEIGSRLCYLIWRLHGEGQVNLTAKRFDAGYEPEKAIYKGGSCISVKALAWERCSRAGSQEKQAHPL